MPSGESWSQLRYGKEEEVPRDSFQSEDTGDFVGNGECKMEEYKGFGGRGLSGSGESITKMTLWESMNNQRDVSHTPCNNRGKADLQPRAFRLDHCSWVFYGGKTQKSAR